MPETAYEVLARVLRDNDAETARSSGPYANGLAASSARLRAAMVGLPRSAEPEWRGKPPEPIDTSPPTHGRIIDAEYTAVDEPDHSEWRMPKDIPVP